MHLFFTSSSQVSPQKHLLYLQSQMVRIALDLTKYPYNLINQSLEVAQFFDNASLDK